jgi:arabinofuranosyltransferase
MPDVVARTEATMLDRLITRMVPPTPVSPTSARTDRIVFAFVVAAFLLYAALFIYRTSFVVAGERYFSLFDDAMVSMRYAMNLANGYGLVWNPGGERVEGFTNPLWVLYMALVHLLPIPQSKTSLLIQVTAAILLAFNLYYVRRIALAVSNGSAAVAWGAVALTALYLPINNWGLQGMEVSVLVLQTSACIWFAIRCMETGAFQIRLYLLLGVGTLVRPDMVVPFGAILLFLLVFDPVRRQTHVAWGVLVLLVAVASQTTFRLWYYGDILPNTFYLKMEGVPFLLRISRGLYVLARFVLQANVLFFALAFALAARRDRRTWLLLWMLIAQMAYSVYVGGDAWEHWGGSNRYICIAMPGFFVLLSFALYVVTTALVDAARADAPRAVSVATRRGAAFALVIAAAIVTVNSIYGPGALAEALLIRAPYHTGNGDRNHRDVEAALQLRRVTTPDATLAVARAGTIPYFADRPGVDLMGKSDPYVAREQARMSTGRRRFVEFRPGHMKFDYAHSIGRLQPDVVVQLWTNVEEATPFLQDAYQGRVVSSWCMYWRRGSSHVLWDRLSPQSCED